MSFFFRHFSRVAIALIWLPFCSSAATISGVITGPTDAEPISGARVVLGAGLRRAFIQQTQTNAQGEYSFTFDPDIPIINGNVIVEAAAPGFTGARYDSDLLLNCFFSCAQDEDSNFIGDGAIQIQQNDDLTGIDINLSPGAVLSGQVIDANTSQGIPNISIRVVNTLGTEFVAINAGTDPNGNYQINAGLAPGDYSLLALDTIGSFVAQANGGIDCEYGECPLVHRTFFTVPDTNPVDGLDFTLRPGAVIGGQLLEAPGVPLSDDAFVRIYAPSGNRMLLSQFVPAGTGNYQFSALRGGAYYLEYDPVDTANSNFVRQLQNGEFCPFAGCDRNAGAPFEISRGTTVSNLDIILPEGGKMSGTLFDASSGQPMLPPAPGFPLQLSIVDSSGTVMGGGVFVDAQAGTWESADGLPPGNYFATTGLNFRGTRIGIVYDTFVDQVSGGNDCQGLLCDLDSATPTSVTVGNTTTNVDFFLNTGSVIEGTVMDAVTLTPIPRPVFVYLYNESGELLGQTRVNTSTGSYRFSALPAGNYFMRTQVAGLVFFANANELGNRYFDQVFGLPQDCAGELCDPTAGTVINLDGINNVADINFNLNAGPNVTGTIINSTTGLVVFGEIEISTVGGELVNRYRVSSVTGQYASGALPPGTYTITTNVPGAFVADDSADVRQFGSSNTFTINQDDITDLNLNVVESYIHANGFEAQ